MPFHGGGNSSGMTSDDARRCPFFAPATTTPSPADSPRTQSNTHDNDIRATSAGGVDVAPPAPSSGNVLSSIMGSTGKGDGRTAGEAGGKRLLVGEVRLEGCPPGWAYKISVNQEHLPPKTVPKWTVWLEVPVGDSISIEILARELTPVEASSGSSSTINGIDDGETGASSSFVAVGSRKNFQPLDFFDVSDVDFASGRVPCPWLGLPDLAVVVEMRLEADARQQQQEAVLASGRLSQRCCAVRQKVKLLSRHWSSARGQALFGETAKAKPPPLTDVEVVIVKDSYNKALAWVDIILEYVVERLFFLVPDLPGTLGGLAPTLQRCLHGIIDLAVRDLDPSSENVSRESYKAVHPDKSRPHQDVEGYARMLAEQGFLLTHWELVRDLWVDALRSSPYMEAYELRNMELGTGSAVHRFFELHVLRPTSLAIARMEDVYDDENNAGLVRSSWKPVTKAPHLKWGLGVEFYAALFMKHPDLVPHFRGADMDALSKRFGEALELVATSFDDMWNAMPILQELGQVHADLGIPTAAHDKMSEVLMELLSDKLAGMSGQDETAIRLRQLWKQALDRTSLQARLPMDNAERLVAKAYEWVDQAAHELSWDETYTSTRKGHIYKEVINRGTYSHTPEELVHGARVCWRNSAKCIGRIAWNTLAVRDMRHIVGLDEMFAECMEHQRLAMADGSIKSVMTVFRPQAPGERMGIRFWNSQLTRYAAYTLDDGSVIGDRANLELTKAIVDNGWVPPSPRGHFDTLPIVLETAEGEIRMFDVPAEYAREVPLEHPDHPAFAKLGLKWGAVPSITNFTMSLGGVEYTACPFNGWFMNTEVARDLMEDGRCARSLEIAASFGIKVSETDPFWKDRTFLELNFAVMHSFRKDGATMVDHHAASQQFMTHDLREKRAGRECPAQWSWIVPPLGGSLTSVFHHEMRHFDKDPRFVYQAEIYRVKHSEHAPVSAEEGGSHNGMGDPYVAGTEKRRKKRRRVLVLYGSETGTAEGYAYETAARLRSLACHVCPLDEVDVPMLTGQDVHAVVVVMSTFGDGGMPQGAKEFHGRLQALSPGALSGVRYSIMALGSSAYPDFCKAGKDMDREWIRLGAKALTKIQLGNELDGQAQSVRDWQSLLEPALGVGPHLAARNGDAGEAQDGFNGDGDDGGAKVVYLDAGDPEVERAKNNPGDFVRKGFALAPVACNEELLKPPAPGRSTRFVEIDISGDGAENLTYETGDHASILPGNDPALVAATLNRIGADHSRWFTVEGNTRPHFPVPTSVARAFVHELDLCTRAPVAALLELVLKKASEDKDKRRIETLLEGQDRPDWARTESEFLGKHTTVLSVLEEFPSAAVSAEDLVLTLPLVRPRHYSISSSAEVHPRALQLTVGVLKVHNKEQGTTRKGLCSHHLQRLTPGELVRIRVRTSSFRAPTSLADSPVIMVGPGTGISPIVGFLQARAQALRKGAAPSLAPCLVYFGCRDSSETLYAEQMRRWVEEGVITELHVAKSREGTKTYVQHLIGRQHAKVWNVLRDPSCHVYLCGDSSMGEEVKAEMMMAALECSSMDRLDVVEYFSAMKKDGRLQCDTWGVGLHGSAAQDAFISNQEGQGRWQSQVKHAAAAAATSTAPIANTVEAATCPTSPVGAAAPIADTVEAAMCPTSPVGAAAPATFSANPPGAAAPIADTVEAATCPTSPVGAAAPATFFADPPGAAAPKKPACMDEFSGDPRRGWESALRPQWWRRGKQKLKQ